MERMDVKSAVSVLGEEESGVLEEEGVTWYTDMAYISSEMK